MPEQFRETDSWRWGRGQRDTSLWLAYLSKGPRSKGRKNLTLTWRNEQPEISWRRRKSWILPQTLSKIWEVTQPTFRLDVFLLWAWREILSLQPCLLCDVNITEEGTCVSPSEGGREGVQEVSRLILITPHIFEFWPHLLCARVTQSSMRRSVIMNKCWSLKLKWDYVASVVTGGTGKRGLRETICEKPPDYE